MSLNVVILAAGQGTRMRSSLPKVLHSLAGKPMVGHVVDTARRLNASLIHLVVGHGAERVREQLAAADVNFVEQLQQLGTGHAVTQALPGLETDARVLILYGDVPLIRAETLQQLLEQVSETSMGLLTVQLDDPSGYGRIIRDADQKVAAIIEQKDASTEQLQIKEVNTGILAVTTTQLQRWLPRLSNANVQGEYYLTDIIGMAYKEGTEIRSVQPKTTAEVEGVNNRLQLAALERVYQREQADLLMEAGVTLADPARIDVRGHLSTARDVFIDVGCVFEGLVELAEGVEIGPYCVLKNARLGPGVKLASHSVIEDAVLVGDNQVGPFARLRPGTHLEVGARIGNFVETKKAMIHQGAKVNHLSYIGDAEVGAYANIGAGTITCNYDGVNKHQTLIGAGAFIGSNTSLVAPVSVGAGATIGAGSTITRDVDDRALAVTRAKQLQKANWPRPAKKQED
ncbi:MAG: bifunctional UDP-N-acetylglucosamine diphosphorylase/glucosamine-1-phosphate N-acetyltransferase GlmU [Marinospirillum sp.]|uniref:bifunctional UDP-N-acetylglucosamine diphosphorylase/glucosamine-1-phosphate N-acetyltransferase GlmU n=1 Tax=Marinospirillum sp. TaxID=2183934 RepID=UPI0019E435E1|nr:bifunctional UDP-N-acetylglucosamine diphosphorylase/glucosamine-1-phosphate N-acetyltransferase GlmU [Marinospirillum sp.]MBE0508042.1 bifunctional UDP-N-acetylglucosamine diphosphorylase/glucosamine-1-phosphate N-acetyltransferase GlmU [Marinospirillum sp.]